MIQLSQKWTGGTSATLLKLVQSKLYHVIEPASFTKNIFQYFPAAFTEPQMDIRCEPSLWNK